MPGNTTRVAAARSSARYTAGSNAADDIAAVTMSEAADTADSVPILPSIFPGFVDQRRLLHLDRPRRRPSRLDPGGRGAAAFDAHASTVSAEARDRAWEEILIAEGSDWFWWYGDDHSSDHDREFDDLFRRHLRNVYTALGLAIPDELFHSNITTGPGLDAAARDRRPDRAGPGRPGDRSRRSGRVPRGRRIGCPSGAMHEVDASAVSEVVIGCGRAASPCPAGRRPECCS